MGFSVHENKISKTEDEKMHVVYLFIVLRGAERNIWNDSTQNTIRNYGAPLNGLVCVHTLHAHY